ncbi:MAG: hypothetical protein RL007_2661, partial [Bacteroidota bacterium]
VPIAVILTRKATADANLFDLESYLIFFKKFLRKNKSVTKIADAASDFTDMQ